MTSIIEQYEQDTHPTVKKTKSSPISDLVNRYSYLNIENEENEEGISMFDKYQTKIPIITSRIQHMCVGGDMIAFVTVGNILYHFNWKNPEDCKEIDISKQNKVKHLFMDPAFGTHIFVSVITSKNTNELLYLNVSFHNKLTNVTTYFKSQDTEITAVAWNKPNISIQRTSQTLLGTSKGLIYEVDIKCENEKLFQNSLDVYSKEMFNIGKGESRPITGLEFSQFENCPQAYFVLATTANRFYQFVGQTDVNDERSVFAKLFSNYLNVLEGFIEIPNSNPLSELRLYDCKEDGDVCKRKYTPYAFGWHIFGRGIIYGQLQLHWEEGVSSVCTQNREIDYQFPQPIPISFLLTEFHVLLLYVDRIVAISVLTKEVAFVDSNEDNVGKYLSMCKDSENNIWLLCERAIFKGKFIAEDRHVWKMYLNMEEFALAKKYCKHNVSHYHKVLRKEAEHYFNLGMYEESASLYVQIEDISFEEVTLKFLQIQKVEALKLYLFKMLEKLKPQESTQITMISFWLLEMFEKQLADARAEDRVEERRKLQQAFETFLAMPQVSNCIKTNKEAVYKILNSHGDSYNLASFSTTNKDYENVIKHYLAEGNIQAALSVLRSESALLGQRNLLKQFLPEFMNLAPKETVDLLTKSGRHIEPLSILTSLIFPYENTSQALEVIRYLEYCVHSLHTHDESVHNYLITLYAKYRPEKIAQYLATQGQDASMVNYDIRYALKLCQEYGLTEMCVQLSALLGLWESAVDLALTVNVDLAKQTAFQAPHQNVELNKKLWLKIAQHVVNECNDIKKAMEFLQQCDLIKIEDVLPFFSDFVTIDLFKQAICSSLQQYNQNIEMLKEEMDDAVNSAEVIRSDIQSFKNRYTVIQSTDVCSSCRIQLLLRPFYIFPCSHYFHADCLVNEVKPYLSESTLHRLESLQQQLLDTLPNSSNDDVSISSNMIRVRDQLKSEIDTIIADECFFCGNLAISQIDKPFISEEDFDKIRLDWE